MPSIAQLRTALGSFADDKNDEQLLQAVAEAKGQSVNDVAGRYGYNPTSSGPTTKRFGASADQYQAGLYGLGEAVTGADFFKRNRIANEFSANVAMERAANQGAINSFEQVQGVGDLPSYVGGLAIQSLPYVGEALVGGLAARGLMSGTRAAATAARAAGDTGALTAATRQLGAGQIGGAVTAAYPSSVADILQNQREQSGGTTDLGSAALYGIPYAALNALGETGVIARGGVARGGMAALDSLQGFTGGLTRAGYNAGRIALEESIGETGQEMLNQGGRMAVDPNAQFLSPEALARYKESAIGGAFLGGAVGGAAGGWRRTQEGGFDLTQRDSNAPPPPLGLSYNPNAGQYVTFPDGSTRLASDPIIVDSTGNASLGANPPTAAGASIDLTAPAPVSAGATPGVTTPVPGATPVPTRDPRGIELRDVFGVIPTPHSMQLYDEIKQSGLPLDADILAPVWAYAADKPMSGKRLEKAQQLLDGAIIAAQKGTANVSTPNAPAAGTPASVGTGAPVVQGNLAPSGSIAPVVGTVGGNAPGTNAPNAQAAISTTPPGQSATPLGDAASPEGKVGPHEYRGTDRNAAMTQYTDLMISGKKPAAIVQVGDIQEGILTAASKSLGWPSKTVNSKSAGGAVLIVGVDKKSFDEATTALAKMDSVGETQDTATALGKALGYSDSDIQAWHDYQATWDKPLYKVKSPTTATGTPSGDQTSETIETKAQGQQAPATSGTATATAAPVTKTVNGKKVRVVASGSLGAAVTDTKIVPTKGAQTELAPEKAAQVKQDADAARNLLVRAFGERDTAILQDALVENLPHAEVATKHGISRGRVVQIVSPANVKEKLASVGGTEDQLRNLLGSLSAQTRAASLTNDQIAQAGNQAVVDRDLEGAGLAIVNSQGGSQGNVLDRTEKGVKLKTKEVAAKLQGLREQLSLAEKSDDLDTAEKVQKEINALEAEYVSPEERIAGKTQLVYEQAQAADELEAKITEAEQAGQTTVALKNAKVSLDEARGMVEELRIKVNDELDKTAALLSALKAPPSEVKPEVAAAQATAAEARKRWNDAGRDLTKLDTSDLQVLRTYTQSINNLDLSGKIAAELQSRGETVGATNAVSEPSAKSVPVQEQPKGGGEVRQGNAQGGQTTTARKTKAAPAETQVKSSEEQWNDLAKTFPQMPAYETLSADEKTRWADVAQRGVANLAAANTILSATVKAAPTENVATPAATGTTEKVEVITPAVVEAHVEQTVDEVVADNPEATQINPEQQAILEQPLSALPEPQVQRLENHYKAKRGTSDFFTKLQNDVTAYATKGAQAVAGAIRDIIRAIHTGVLAVAMVFNPSVMTQNSEVIVVAPQIVSTTTQVKATIPAAAKANMSTAAQEAYQTLYPAIKDRLVAENKFMVITDKPNARLFIFNPNGSLFLQKKVLVGRTIGDFYKGNTDKVENRITPAGLFTLGLRDATRSENEKRTAGEYDFGKVFVLDKAIDGEYSVTLFHSVWTNEKDAAQRLEALKKEGAADSRYSFGCINVDKATFGSLVANNLNQMDGAALFVVPDKQELIGEFLTGDVAKNKSGKDELTRTTFTPKTETTTRTNVQKNATSVAGGRSVVGKEEKFQFGVNSVAKNPYTAAELATDIQEFIRADILGSKLIIVDNLQALLESPLQDLKALATAIGDKGAYGVAVDGKAYLIANRIEKGDGRAKFMHEVGGHLGLENLLPKVLFNKLTSQLDAWAKADNGSVESELAKAAQIRVEAANTPAADRQSEMLAYFIEEAVQAGIDPTAAGKESAALQSWFRTLWAAFKVAIRRLGFKTEAVTAQDIVNLAFGAARLEITGTWHGTAADFRKFNHAFMSSGEGAQAFGWGTYLAQRVGVAKGYFVDDVKRKTTSRKFKTDSETLKKADVWLRKEAMTDASPTTINQAEQWANWIGKTLPDWAYANGGKPEGSLMRVDTSVSDSEMIDWDAPIADQPPLVKEFLADFLAEETTASAKQIKTGSDIYKYLLAKFYKEAGNTGKWDYAEKQTKLEIKKEVSQFLDDVGIKGHKFLDQLSRGDKFQSQIKLKQLQEVLQEKEIAVEKATKEAAKWEALQDKAPPEKKEYARKTWLNAVAARTSAEFQAEEVRQEVEILKQKVIGLDNRTRNVVIYNDKNIFRVGTEVAADIQRMKFGVNTPPTQSFVQQAISALPKVLQQPVRNSVGAIRDVAGKYLDYAVFTGDLVNRAVAAGLPSAKDFVQTIALSKAKAREAEQAVEKIADMYALVPDKDRGTGPASVNQFLFDSTRESKWGYGKYRNDVMGPRFDKLSKEAQDFVKAVFDHGATVLAQKKKVVLDSAVTEYDAMIEAAQDANDLPAKAKLESEKAATLKRFQTLFKVREGLPYAPIKRTGDHAVVAKSTEYIQAELAKNTKRIKELESDPDHYHVSFTDGKWDARTLQSQLQDQGFFQDVQILERDDAVNSLYGGASALRELASMRSRVEAAAAAGDKSSSKLLGVISQMYLEALAENSARKSEMRRRGVAGEVDMVQSFAQQGRADAQFMASVQYNPQVQDSLQKMRNDAKTGNRERKSEIFNELSRRYIQSMEYYQNPWINKLTRVSSLYFLATSPAYYLQNLTQPWIMTVPSMAGRHGYTEASGALFKAYTELGDVMKGSKLLKQQFDFSKVPADVRDAIKELVNRGKIDIGLDSEIGEFRVEGEGYVREKLNSVDKAMRLAVQKVESINRLSSGIAAYRLELAKTNDKTKALNYADQILTDTHGDYTAFNAPRVFNNPVGKVMLQFRKFQLIQLAFHAKLIKDALQGRERAAALKALTYSLGHTAALAGVMGLPGYAAIAWAISKVLSGDDDKYDVEEEIRKAIGDEGTSNLVLRGAPTIAGMDISGKVGAGNMLSVLPFNNADVTTKAGLAQTFGTLVGGASLGMVANQVDGLGLMMAGDWYKGLERMMPKGVGDAMKAYRISNEGMTRRNGDVVLPAEEVTGVDTLLQAIGISPIEQARVYERQQVIRDQDQRFKDRAQRITQDYVRAMREGDSENAAKAREAWMNLQQVRMEKGYTRQPLSTLLKAPQAQRQREKDTAGGVQFTKANKRAVMEEAEL